MIMLDKPDQIEAYRLLVLYHRCKMEAAGLKFRINTCQAVREQFGIKARKRADVVKQFEAILREKGVLK